jgi:hypothetical protein
MLDPVKLKDTKMMIPFLNLFYKRVQKLKVKSEENWKLLKAITPQVTKVAPANTQFPKVNAILMDEKKKEMESAELANFYTPDNSKDTFDFSPWMELTPKKTPVNEDEDYDFFDLGVRKEVPEKKPPGGCFGKCFSGKCNAPASCKHHHDDETLTLTWQYYFELLKSSPYKASNFPEYIPETNRQSSATSEPCETAGANQKRDALLLLTFNFFDPPNRSASFHRKS